MKKTFVISLGGSLVAPADGINWKFIKELKSLLLVELKKGSRFFLIVGGGNVCRRYQEAAKKIGRVGKAELDWLGIYSTYLNAQLVRVALCEHAYECIIMDINKKIKTDKQIIMAGGWKPGRSTDYVATAIAKIYGAKTLLNLSNIDYVYDRDPTKYSNAVKFEKLKWPQMFKIVGNKWDPGLNAPFDPVASRLAAKTGLRVVIMNGQNINEVRNFFAGKKFKGTVIE